MKLTAKLLTQLERSLRLILTPEQRVIMLYWYGQHEPRHGWDEQDFVHGINDVLRYYPDHRDNPDPFSGTSINTTLPDGQPF
jgi:hypothetical protein